MAKLKRETVKALALQLPDKGKALADLLKEMGHEIEAATPQGVVVRPGDVINVAGSMGTVVSRAAYRRAIKSGQASFGNDPIKEGCIPYTFTGSHLYCITAPISADYVITFNGEPVTRFEDDSA